MSPATENYMLSRSFSANTRQTCQHYLFKDGLNYLLHPSIPTNKKALKVAEVGVGTGIWLIELARALPDTAELDGFDINFEQCPPPEWMPKNVSFHHYDMFDEPAPELQEKYDVIHAQLLITLIRDNSPVPVLRNLMKMLKPGGYIQWGEWDFATWHVIRTLSAPSQDNDELTKSREYLSSLGGSVPQKGFAFASWVGDLHNIYRNNSIEPVAVDRQRFAPEIATLLLDTWMVASLEISVNVLDPLGGGRGDVLRGYVEEIGRNRQNTTFNIDRVISVGRKPLH